MNRYRMLPTYRYYEAEGYPLSLGKTAGKLLRDYKIYGNMVQQGTPSTDNPVDILGVGDFDEESGKYKISIVSRGKNLCDNKWEIGFINSTGVNQSTDQYIRSVNYIPLKGGVMYYLSSPTLDGKEDGTNQTVSWVYYDKNKNYISGIVSWKDRYITPPTETAYVRWYVRVTDLNTKIMVEEGSTASDYEPYVEPTVTNIYLDEPLRHIDNGKASLIATDNIDFGTGRVNRKTLELVLTGDENWVLRTTTEGTMKNTFRYSPGFTIQCGYCSHYPYTTTSAKWDVENCVYLANTSTIIITDMNCSTADEFKAYLKAQYEAGTPVKLIVTDKDGTKVQPVDIDLPEIPTQKGVTNIIETDTQVLPSNIWCQYYK